MAIVATLLIAVATSSTSGTLLSETLLNAVGQCSHFASASAQLRRPTLASKHLQ